MTGHPGSARLQREPRRSSDWDTPKATTCGHFELPYRIATRPNGDTVCRDCMGGTPKPREVDVIRFRRRRPRRKFLGLF